MKRVSVQINSFFIEIILVILFFAISAAVTLQLFVAASNRAQQSSDLSAAVMKAENIAEQVSAITSADQLPESLKNAEQATGGRYLIYYDKDWNPTKADPHYVIGVTLKKSPSEAGTLVRADIDINRRQNGSEKDIYRLNSAKYLPKS